jgi:dihydrofolate synthase/folylpolyglutamate synthase
VDFDEAVSYFSGLVRLGIKLGNERFVALLERLGNPQIGLRCIHIAGTKGKGSTAVFASSILTAAGYKVGTYLSPYVYDLRERVQINGEMIPRDDFARLVTKIRQVSLELERDHPELECVTEFEFKTAVGFCYFAEQNVDYAVIEVGLGGRLDATNVIENPLVSVITNIGFDHTNLLGNTLAAIAGEKAGIIKDAGRCVTGTQDPEALGRISDVAQARSAELIRITPGLDWGNQILDGENRLWVHTQVRQIMGLRVGMRGEFQLANAALAVHAIDNCEPRIEVSDESVRCGLSMARVPGRMEIVRTSAPLVIMDAAHNAMAAEALGRSLAREFDTSSCPLCIVVGMSKGHEPDEFLKSLLEALGTDRTRLTVIATEPAFRPRETAEVAEAALGLGVARVIAEPNVEQAAGMGVEIASKLGERSILLVTGSFFTLGELNPVKWQEILTAHGFGEIIPKEIAGMRSGEEAIK